MRAAVLQLVHGGWPILVRVDYAALKYGDRVEVAGAQLRRDGTPQGRVWLTVDAQDLPTALVGWVELPHMPGVR
ncbi:hypothetical protein [Micromonospora thermarum]|uniref:Uncharacterized protein n=1 Tax=Micromonospora thermarum TaxID=2720024 RepID=A0ABX0Z872_9ACTN|nr:hypothetical protein [Micromonospora thermarum]NJP33673.1 hypothetical protein [Micromonospora thermarum]